MASLRIGDKDYILRADLNSIGEIQEKFGTLETAPGDIKAMLYIGAALINEHLYFIHEKDRVTPEYLGSMLSAGDAHSLRTAITEAFSEGFGNPKNA